MTEKPKDPAKVKAGQTSRTHGMRAFDARGDAALEPKQRGRYAELRDQLASAPGREDYRLELLTHLAMLLDLGWSDLRQRAEQGDPIWKSSPIQRMGTYVNATMRLLDSFPRDRIRGGISAELEKIQERLEVEDEPST